VCGACDHFCGRVSLRMWIGRILPVVSGYLQHRNDETLFVMGHRRWVASDD
jgi:hypothetical protein